MMHCSAWADPLVRRMRRFDVGLIKPDAMGFTLMAAHLWRPVLRLI
ncbi:MAG: hypothetical protein KO206_00115 [Methanomicrobiaceae archaeon]|nr:hypothetical protein [Methanomicrobiaceae archaeon]MDD5418927.1 hypothetical protein [Methanomicrobiaceae archaeon]